MNSTTSIIDNLVEQCVPKKIDQFLNKTSTMVESMKSFQTTINDNNNNEILPNDLDENTNIRDDQMNLKSLIEQLKNHIDLLYRQLNLQRNGVQMFNRFVQRNTQKNTSKHYERFRRNYCYWNKKCRKLSKHQQQQQIKTSPYEILHRLYVNLPEQQPKNSSNSDEISEANQPEICITEKDIEISLTTPETNKTNATTKIAYYFCSIIDCGEIFSDKETLISHLQGHKLFDIKVLDRNSAIENKAEVQDEEEESIRLLAEKKQQSNQIELNHQCFVRSCSKKFSAKEDFLNHLFQHSIITNNKQRKQSTTTKRRKTQTKICKQTAKAKQNVAKKKINKENRIEDEDDEDEEIELISDELGSSLEENKVNEERQCGTIRKSQRRIEKLSKSTRKVTKKLVTTTKKSTNNKDVQTKSSNTGSNKVAIAAASKNIACSFEGCSYVAKNQSVLKCHQVIHSPERPFKCDQCPQAFKYQCSLQAHQKIHFGIRYHCRFENCDANYSDERILRKHVAIVHTKSAPRFSCTWVGCQYNSCRMDLLRKHYKVHTGERPYACIWPGCEKTFKTLSSQHGHMLIHKNERQYKCTWPGCNYSCNLGGNLRKHEAIHEKKRT